MIFILNRRRTSIKLSTKITFLQKRLFKTSQEWRCVVKTCYSTATSAINHQENLLSFTVLHEHNHPADSRRVTSKVHANRFKSRLMACVDSSGSIVHSVLRGSGSDIKML
jgi:hypothetical protein